jgi:hypothetical protein
MTLEGLSRKTGCSLDEPARDEPLVIDVPGTGAVPTASDSGVQIIEIP